MKYLVGIDLGTTNSSLAYVDVEQRLSLKTFLIPQLGLEGNVVEMSALPSCCYLMPGTPALPWKSPQDYGIGQYALQEGAKVPTRLVQSPKSWLCYAHAKRQDPILPLDAENVRISPVEASRRVLNHLREAWNYAVAKGDAEKELEAQEIVLTVPASFDEVARALTVTAAKEAGFLSLTLLEEPQAAFYNWMATHEGAWEKHLKVGDHILIVDIGGGTSDFSLIEVKQEGESLCFERTAVGNHLLLGGDNMDEALARKMGGESSPALRCAAREAKEVLLAESAPSFYRVVLQGKGSSVVKKTTTLQLERAEVYATLVEGFFGKYAWEEAIQLPKKSGLRPMGLPYEEEPSITKQLAAFLHKAGKKPTHVLFNGAHLSLKSFGNAFWNHCKTGLPTKPFKSWNHRISI